MTFRSLSSVKVGEKMEYGYKGGWGEYLPQAVVTVVSVGTNAFKTDDGSKWKMRDGRKWGESHGNQHIGFFTPEDEAEWVRVRELRALRNRIPRNFDLNRQPLEMLRLVVPILFPEERPDRADAPRETR